MLRGEAFLTEDSTDNVENEEFSTPPSTPNVSKKAPVKAPKSLSRTGAKVIARKVQFMQRRLDDLRDCALSPECSFFVAEWSGTEIELDTSISKDEHPDANVQVLFERLLAVHASLTSRFSYVSGVYIGKTGSIPERFNTHRARKGKPDHMIVMVGIALFTVDDVHDDDQRRWHMTPDIVALQYERLLTDKILSEGITTFENTQETGGGGRATASATKNVAIYVLYSVSNHA